MTWTAGQKVFEPSNSSWTGFPGRVLKIDRVTPSGRAIIGDVQYHPSGSRIGGGKWNTSRIRPHTEADDAALVLWDTRQKLGERIEKLKWRELNQQQCDRLIAALIEVSA